MTFKACAGSDAYTRTVKRLRIEDAQAASRPVVVDVLREPGIRCTEAGLPPSKKNRQEFSTQDSPLIVRGTTPGAVRIPFYEIGRRRRRLGKLAFSLAAGGNS